MKDKEKVIQNVYSWRCGGRRKIKMKYRWSMKRKHDIPYTFEGAVGDERLRWNTGEGWIESTTERILLKVWLE